MLQHDGLGRALQVKGRETTVVENLEELKERVLHELEIVVAASLIENGHRLASDHVELTSVRSCGMSMLKTTNTMFNWEV